jgi:hypothetical protein
MEWGCLFDAAGCRVYKRKEPDHALSENAVSFPLLFCTSGQAPHSPLKQEQENSRSKRTVFERGDTTLNGSSAKTALFELETRPRSKNRQLNVVK